MIPGKFPIGLMIPIFKQTRFYFFTLLVFWLALGVVLIQDGYQGSFLRLNALFHTPFTDFLGINLTHLADGVILPLVLLLFAARKERSLPLMGLILIIGTGLFAQIFKQLLFAGWDRPTLVFAGNTAVHFLDPSSPKHFSFPSGHSTAFAAGGFLFAWLVRDRKPFFQVAVGVFTALLCYTRTHIGVHFPGDLLVGSMIGSLGGLALFSVLKKPLETRFETIPDRRYAGALPWLFMAAGLFIALRFFTLVVLDPIEKSIELDHQLFALINGAHNPFFDFVFSWLSNKFVWIPFYALLLFFIWKKWGWQKAMLLALLVIPLITLSDLGASAFFKPLVARFRPCQPEGFFQGLVHTVDGKCGGKFGFMSSHAANFFALATYLSLTFGRGNYKLYSIFGVCALLVAYSRVYLGVHYPLDVVAGAILGLLAGIAISGLFYFLEKRLISPKEKD